MKRKTSLLIFYLAASALVSGAAFAEDNPAEVSCNQGELNAEDKSYRRQVFI